MLLLPLLSRFLTPPAHLSARLTKTQLLIVTALSYHESFHMSQLAAYLSFSKEQATRAPRRWSRLVLSNALRSRKTGRGSFCA
ncbi:MAG: hypothetical protein ACLR8U_01340 [Oscillospiraceae bacterium]